MRRLDTSIPVLDDLARWRRLHAAASEPYRAAGRFAWHFARGKLGRDPVFRAIADRGWIPRGARVLDIGCGRGLVGSLLRACEAGASYRGIELTRADVAVARRALGDGEVAQADMRTAALPVADVIVMLDVLHYVDRADQDALLARVVEALAPGGRLLLRIADANARGSTLGRGVDRLVARLRGYRVAPRSGRSLGNWKHDLWKLGFKVVAHPMSQGTPFANVLLVCDLIAP